MILAQKFSQLFQRISQIQLDPQTLDPILSQLSLDLIQADVGYEVALHICSQLRDELIGAKIPRSKLRSWIKSKLGSILAQNMISMDFDGFAASVQKPAKLVFLGVNGTGKTLTLARLGYKLIQDGYSVVFACADTFRAGALEQLEMHAQELGVKLIKHRYGSDPAAVVYDAYNYARAHGVDFVLADTAGRMHTDKGLMDELAKICRVNSPHLKIFVDEAIAGNDALERARRFNQHVGIDCSIITKFDLDLKGGCLISIGYITRKPIAFLGTGQSYDSLVEFDPQQYISRLLEGI